MSDEYPALLIENIIIEIFSDEKLAKKRVSTEIKLYQENNREELEQLILNNSYNVSLTPDKVYGLGLSLTVDSKGIIISGFKTNTEDKTKLPAELCKSISKGDRLLKINGQNIDDLPISEAVSLLKKFNYGDKEVQLQLMKPSKKNKPLPQPQPQNQSV